MKKTIECRLRSPVWQGLSSFGSVILWEITQFFQGHSDGGKFQTWIAKGYLRGGL